MLIVFSLYQELLKPILVDEPLPEVVLSQTPDKKPSAAENLSTKFSQHVKNATPVAARSLVAPAN
jgi:hypothetical protein